MDDVDRYLNLLTNRFPDQMVLYLDDIVKVLSTTKRAVEGLIQRKSFPFETRKIGGRVCVDILQVARYLAGEQMGESSIPPPVATAKPKRQRAQPSPAKAQQQSASNPSPVHDRYAIRKKLAEWRKQQAYNCYQLLGQPLEEGVGEALPLLLMELLRVNEPMITEDHIAIWRFRAEGESLEPELATFPLDRLKNPYDLTFLISRRLEDHRVAIAQTFRDGLCVAEGLYVAGELVKGSTPKELVSAV